MVANSLLPIAFTMMELLPLVLPAYSAQLRPLYPACFGLTPLLAG